MDAADRFSAQLRERRHTPIAHVMWLRRPVELLPGSRVLVHGVMSDAPKGLRR
jgi:hypothetical protein